MTNHFKLLAGTVDANKGIKQEKREKRGSEPIKTGADIALR
jgi:hypothetical protein